MTATGYRHETSGLAWNYQVKKNLTERQKPVYEVILRHPEGVTNAEIGAELKWDINNITPRTGELLKKGLIFRLERRICRKNNNPASPLKAVTDSLF